MGINAEYERAYQMFAVVPSLTDEQLAKLQADLKDLSKLVYTVEDYTGTFALFYPDDYPSEDVFRETKWGKTRWWFEERKERVRHAWAALRGKTSGCAGYDEW